MSVKIEGVGRYYEPGERSNRAVIRGSFDGQQYEITTDETNPRGIKRFWDDFKASTRAKNSGIPQEEIKTFADAFMHYKATDVRSAEQIGFIEAVMHRFNDTPVGDIKPGFVRQVALESYPQAANSTRNRQVLGPISAVINCFADDDNCNHIRIKKFQEVKREKRPASEETEIELLENTLGYENLYLSIIFRQGWRITETVKVIWEDNIDLQEQEFILYVGKAKTENRLPMHSDVYDALCRVPEAERTGKLFPWKTRFNVYTWLNRLCDDLGIEFTSHRARDKWASDRNEDGFTDYDMVAGGSWTDRRSLSSYVDVDKEQARRVVERDRKNKGKSWGGKRNAM